MFRRKGKAARMVAYITSGMCAPLFTGLDHHPAVVWDGSSSAPMHSVPHYLLQLMACCNRGHSESRLPYGTLRRPSWLIDNKTKQ